MIGDSECLGDILMYPCFGMQKFLTLDIQGYIIHILIF